MTKTSKKILLAILLFIAVILVNAKVFASFEEEAFEEFKNKKFEPTEYISEYGRLNLPWGLYKFNPTVSISNNDVAEYSDDDICAKKQGKTDVKISATYNKETVTKSFKVEVVEDDNTADYKRFVNHTYDSTYNLCVGGMLNPEVINKLNTLEASVKVSDTNVVKVDTEDYIKIIAKKAGTTKVTISLNNNGQVAEKSFNIKVTDIKNNNAKLESKTDDVENITIVSKNKTVVLLANGELWKADPKTFKLTSKAKGNVARFVYTDTYFYEGQKEKNVRYEAIFYKDNSAEFTKGTTAKGKNITDFTGAGYLTKKGDYYGIIATKDDKIKIKKKVTGVDKLLGYHLVRKGGKLYTIDNVKISDKKVQDAVGMGGSGKLLSTKGKLYKYYYDYKKKKYFTEKIADNVKKIVDYNTYITKNGKKVYINKRESSNEEVSKYISSGYCAFGSLGVDKKHNLYLNDIKICSNVDKVYSVWTKIPLIVKKDGSIWKFDSEQSTLIKVRSGKNSEKRISKPTNVKAKKKSSKKVKVSWKKVKGAKKYTVYRAKSKNGKYKKIGTTKSGSYTDKTIKKGKKYYYKVVANTSKKLYNSFKSDAAKAKT